MMDVLRRIALCGFIVFLPVCIFSQEDFLLNGKEKIPSLEEISKQVGNPIAVITWRTLNGNLRIKSAVKCGNYERRYMVENGIAVFQDRAEFEGTWQDWYQTGANKLTEGEELEIILEQVWGSWESGITLYRENINKTMLIKFYKSHDNGFVKNEDGYLYLYGYWYLIDGKL